MRYTYLRWRMMRLFRRMARRFSSKREEAGSIDYDPRGIYAIDVRAMRKGDVITVRTMHSVYSIALDDPAMLAVAVWGGALHFVERSYVRFNGSLVHPDGAALLSGKIIRGHSLEFALGGLQRKTTSLVLGIAVNGVVPVEEDPELVH